MKLAFGAQTVCSVVQCYCIVHVVWCLLMVLASGADCVCATIVHNITNALASLSIYYTCIQGLPEPSSLRGSTLGTSPVEHQDSDWV